jgi:fumarate hydratase class II
MAAFPTESDSLGEVRVPAERLWGAQTQRSLEHFGIGEDLIPREMISVYAVVKKAAANANHAGCRLGDRQRELIVHRAGLRCPVSRIRYPWSRKPVCA